MSEVNGVRGPNSRHDPPGPIFLSVVFPAYNEETSIEQVLQDHLQTLAALHGHVNDWEIVCVDDASTDATPQILERITSRTKRIRVLRHEKNQGIYQSFADGFKAAQGTHIYLTAADGQWPAQNLQRMFPFVAAGTDLVVGVRLNRWEVYSWGRQFVSSMFNLLPRILFGVKTADAGSIKLGVREVFRFDLLSRSPFVEAERIILARRCGFHVEFVPIEFRARKGGKARGANWNNVVQSARDCVRCARKYGVFFRVERDTTNHPEIRKRMTDLP